jgi:hypothetical protein
MEGEEIVDLVTSLIPLCGLPPLNSPKYQDFANDSSIFDYKSSPIGWRTNFNEMKEMFEAAKQPQIEVSFTFMGISRYSVIDKSPLEELELMMREYRNAQDEIKDDTKLYDIVDKIRDLTSKNFICLFEKNDCLTVNKTIAIFEYFLKIIYECVNSTINEYQEDDIDESTKEKINNYFLKKHSFNKSDLAYAIRLFMSLVLFQEEDKENKIKSNQNNIVNYLKSTDLWKCDINDDSFINDLNELKSINIHINQIIALYDYLGKDIVDNYFEDVEQKIKSETNQILDNGSDDEENKNKSDYNEDNEDNEDKSEKSNNDDDDDRY